VEVKDMGDIPINQLKIGDYVRVGNSKFSQVYGFGHLSHDLDAEFLQIQFDGNSDEGEDHSHVLEISSSHLLFVTKNTSHVVLSASDVKLGDVLSGKQVKSIERITRRGVYAPLTQSGDIVVSGIRASNYIALIDSALVWNQHYLGHTYFFPRRLFCNYFMQTCMKESYTNGFSNWAYPTVHVAESLEMYGHSASSIVGLMSTPIVGLVYVFGSLSNLGFFSMACIFAISLAMATAYRSTCLRT
jgi:Hint module